jgi:hypothetical protein
VLSAQQRLLLAHQAFAVRDELGDMPLHALELHGLLRNLPGRLGSGCHRHTHPWYCRKT